MTSYNKSIECINYFRTDDSGILFKEINDYSFSSYFNILKTSKIVFLDTDLDVLVNININDVLNKITIYNLLIRHILTFRFMNNKLLKNNDNSTDNSSYNSTKNYKLINNIDIIFWINLDKSVKRKLNMNSILSKFDVTNRRIEAIDGSILKDISNKYFYCEDNKPYPNFSNKEYAILATHLKAIDEYCNISKEELKYGVGLICEDDLSLDFYKYWQKDIKSIIEEAPDDWEIILLGYFSLNLNRRDSFSVWNNEWSAISYLVRYDKIKIKIDELKINDSKKWRCFSYDLMVSDNYIFSKFKTYVYKYPYFTFPNDNDSTFHDDHLDYHRIYKGSNYITLEGIYNIYSEK